MTLAAAAGGGRGRQRRRWGRSLPEEPLAHGCRPGGRGCNRARAPIDRRAGSAAPARAKNRRVAANHRAHGGHRRHEQDRADRQVPGRTSSSMLGGMYSTTVAGSHVAVGRCGALVEHARFYPLLPNRRRPRGPPGTTSRGPRARLRTRAPTSNDPRRRARKPCGRRRWPRCGARTRRRQCRGHPRSAPKAKKCPASLNLWRFARSLCDSGAVSRRKTHRVREVQNSRGRSRRCRRRGSPP